MPRNKRESDNYTLQSFLLIKLSQHLMIDLFANQSYVIHDLYLIRNLKVSVRKHSIVIMVICCHWEVGCLYFEVSSVIDSSQINSFSHQTALFTVGRISRKGLQILRIKRQLIT